MPAREIPGFYFDEERNKYFRIQPDHRAPEGSAHSRSAIKAKKEATEIEQVKQDRETRERKGQIRRHDPTSYTSLSLALRLGQRRNILEKLTTNYVSRFERSSSKLIGGRRLEAFTATPNGQLYTMITSSDGRSPHQLNHSTACSEVCRNSLLWIHAGRRDWTSLISVADRYLLSASGPTVTCIPLDPAGDSDGDFHTTDQYHDLTITDIAAPSDNYSLQTALATNNGLYIGKTSLHNFPQRCSTLYKEQTVVNFQDSNIIMSGERSGAVNFTDVRAPSTVHRLQHSSAVNGVVTGRTSDHIIVSGLGTVAIYDLRYSKSVYKKRKRAAVPSMPLVPCHVPRTHRSNHYTSGKNLAYSSNLDVAIVACQTSPPNTGSILLYNGSTGQIVDSPISKDRFQNMRGVAISRVRDGPESIFVGEAGGLHEYSVDKIQEEDEAKIRSPNYENVSEKTHNRGGDGRNGIKDTPNLETDRFPQDAELGMAELWRNGDRGPS